MLQTAKRGTDTGLITRRLDAEPQHILLPRDVSEDENIIAQRTIAKLIPAGWINWKLTRWLGRARKGAKNPKSSFDEDEVLRSKQHSSPKTLSPSPSMRRKQLQSASEDLESEIKLAEAELGKFELSSQEDVGAKMRLQDLYAQRGPLDEKMEEAGLTKPQRPAPKGLKIIYTMPSYANVAPTHSGLPTL